MEFEPSIGPPTPMPDYDQIFPPARDPYDTGNGFKVNVSLSFIKLNVQTFQPLILINRRGNFVYTHWGCTSIYRPLSFPYRSLLYIHSCFSMPMLCIQEVVV